MDGGRWLPYGTRGIHDSIFATASMTPFSGKHSGWHTEDLVTQTQLIREEQDRFAAARSSASARPRRPASSQEIVAVEVRGKKGVEAFAVDEAPRADDHRRWLSCVGIPRSGTITTGNAPGLSEAQRRDRCRSRLRGSRSVEPMARLVAYGVAAVEPGMFGLGPVPAVRKALERAGWKLSDVERIEINEAFAAVPLAVAQELGLPEDIINVEGGTIAHGHPIGATGAVLTTRLLHAMRREGIRRGMVTLCIGGGQGIALALEGI